MLTLFRSSFLKSFVLFAFALLLFARNSFAQNTDKLFAVGVVLDAETGETVPFVTIETRSGKELGQANSKGRFGVEIENKKVILVLKKNGYQSLEYDLGELADVVDIEISLTPSVRQLQDVNVQGARRTRAGGRGAQSLEQLEKFQGMKMDLAEHLAQMQGVNVPSEYSSELSVYGGRTEDATHYLGRLRVPNLRHLDFGFPGSQSVINPRLLSNISVEDNMSQGPLNQGNSSALHYELKPGDPEYITGDAIFGTINQEFNLSGYNGPRSFVASGRMLAPTFLATLGKSFYTVPKTSRIGRICDVNKEDCSASLDHPIDIASGDLYVGYFNRDTLGNSSRFHLLFVGDDFTVTEDIATDYTSTTPRTVQKGEQTKIHFGYENEMQLADGNQLAVYTGYYRGIDKNELHDTVALDVSTVKDRAPWYSQFTDLDPLMDHTEKIQNDFGVGTDYMLRKSAIGGRGSYGLEIHYLSEERNFKTLDGGKIIDASIFEYTAMVRNTWIVQKGHSLSGSLGLYGLDAKPMYPLVGLRYNNSTLNILPWYTDVSIRHSSRFTPSRGGFEKYDSTQFRTPTILESYTTSSVEAKIGAENHMFDWMALSGSIYSRAYLEPLLPEPDAYWHYREKQSSDYAWVNGASFQWVFTPWHKLGWFGNASITQGDYYLANGGVLPWEANHSLGLVSHIRIQPRRDSLFSIVFTYTAQNDQPLYAWDLDTSRIVVGQRANQTDFPMGDVGTRSIRSASEFDAISRQRLDARLQVDLKSKWKPINQVRFFFELVNVLDNREVSGLEWLGGYNQKVRGYTRNSEGDMEPVLIRGMGLFILFGLHVNLAI